MGFNTAWKTDNYKFVGKAFENRYANRINTLAPLLGTKNTTSIDYELTGAGGFGEMKPYNGKDVNIGSMKRGFKTIIAPAFEKNIMETNCIFCGHWVEGKDKLGPAYVCGLNGWYDHKSGIERNDNELMKALTNHRVYGGGKA